MDDKLVYIFQSVDMLGSFQPCHVNWLLAALQIFLLQPFIKFMFRME